MKLQSSVESIIIKREVRGLKIATYFRLFLFGGFFFINLFLQYENSFYGNIAKYLTQVIVFFGVLIGIYFLRELNRLRKINLVGLLGCIFDCFVIIILPSIWYSSVGGNNAGIPRLFIIKSEIVRIVFAFIVLNSLSLRFIYPFIITCTSFLLQVFHFIYAYPQMLEQNSFAKSYIEVNLGDKFMLDAFFTNLFLFVCTGIGISYLTWIIRKTIYEAAIAEKENTQISRYFSPAIADKIKSASNEFMKPGGNLQEVGILFSDIRNFTTLSEALTPKETMEMLSEYHEKMVKVIFDNGGTLDKFIGDGIMATFGTPNPGQDDAENTLKAALAMRNALEEFNLSRKKRQLLPISSGIGIHFGEVIAGNIGTPERLEYTIIGDNVNIASRIESTCKELKVDLLCSANLIEKIPLEKKKNLAIESGGIVLLKGKSNTLEVFKVSGKI